MTDRSITFGRVPVVVDNPLLDEAKAADQYIEERGIGDNSWRLPMDLSPSAIIGRASARDRLSKTMAWAIPNQEVLEAIAAWSPIVELFAGTGYWASLLAKMGADVIAYDASPGYSNWTDHACYFPVETGNHLAAAAHPDRALFICWPPMVEEVLVGLKAYTGNRLIYVGEWEGCCAEPPFFDALREEWTEERCITIPQWPYLHDYAWLFTRKEK